MTLLSQEPAAQVTATNDSLSTYRVPRFRDVPTVEVVLIDHPEIPSAGGGEVPLIAVAPAIANALRGVRLPPAVDAACAGWPGRLIPRKAG